MSLQRLYIEEERITVERKGKLEEISAVPIGVPCLVRSNNYHTCGHIKGFSEEQISINCLIEDIEKIARDNYLKANAYVAFSNIENTREIGRFYYYSNFAVQFYRISEENKR